MAVIMQSNTIAGISTLTVGTGDTNLNGVAYAPTVTSGSTATNLATTAFVEKTATRPSIDYVSNGTYNSFLILSNGKVYEAHGTPSFEQATTGRNLVNESYVTGIDRASIVPIPDTSPVIQVAGGYYSWAAALCANGNLYTWGMNPYGECGLGHQSQVVFPTLAATGVAEIYEHPTQGAWSVSYNHLFIKKNDGYVYGCGNNQHGTLGLGDTAVKTTFQQLTVLGTNPRYVAPLGNYVGCAVCQRSDGKIYVAGYNGYGQLGNGTTGNVTTWTDVTSAWNNTGDSTYVLKQATGGFGYSTSSSGTYGTVAMWFDNGTTSFFKTCGSNDWGQLGNGNAGNTYTPYTVFNTLSGRIKNVMWQGDVVGGAHVLFTNGNLYSWGYNGYGQLGVGDESYRYSPTLSATGVSELPRQHQEHTYGHYNTSFMIKSDGLYACGIGNYGQGGWGDTSNRSSWTRVLLPGTITADKIKFLGQTSTTGSTRCYVLVTTDNTMYCWGYNGQYFVFPWNGVSNVASPVLVELTRGD